MKAAVVIGADANALVAAHLLSKAGFSVSVLHEEKSEEEAGWVPAPIARLAGSELKLAHPDPWAVAPLAQGGRLELWHDMARSVASIRAVSAKDAAKWPEFCARMARLAGLLETLYLEPPPDPLGVRFALRARRLGKQGLVDLMRIAPMSVAELLDDWFESDVLKGVLAGSAVLHLQQGPRSGGTALRLLHHHVGSPPGVFRSPRSNLQEVLLKGMDVQPGKVKTIKVTQGKATGVTLEDGTELTADLVLSAAHPRRTLTEWVDPVWLDPELARALRHLRARPIAARASVQLDRAPGFTRLVLAPSLDALERAYDDSKYGRVSQRPYLEALVVDQNRLEVEVQYVPERADVHALGDVVAAMLSEHLGDAQIASVEVAPPRQPHQVELALDQALWMRPLPELAHYRTPIAGLWLCGAAMHPGGLIAGAAGYNAAQAVLAR